MSKKPEPIHLMIDSEKLAEMELDNDAMKAQFDLLRKDKDLSDPDQGFALIFELFKRTT